MLTYLNLIILNISLLFLSEVNSKSIQKGDSCLNAEDFSCAVLHYSNVEESDIEFASETERMKFYLNYSDALYSVGNFAEAQIYYQLLKSIAVQNQNKFYKGKAHTGIAHSLWRMTDNVASIREILEAIEIFTELKDTSNLIISSNILAGIFVSIEKYDEAQKLYKDMLDIAVKSNDSSNIAYNFDYLGIIDFYKNDFKKAIVNYKKSLEINTKLNNSIARAINLSNISEAYLELGEYEKALEILHEAKKIQKRHNYKSVLIFSYYTLGKIHSQLESYDSAMIYYENSLKLMDKTEETRDKPEVYRLIAQNLEKQGNYKKAYKYHQLYTAQKDSLIAAERTRQLEEIKTRYEVRIKIKENEDLLIQNTEKQKELDAQQELIHLQYAIGILIFIFLIISLFLAIKLYRTRQTLINANNSKDKLFGIIAHDLKGPIGNIGAMIHLLQKEQNESNKSQYFEYLTQSIKNISDLTNQLLSWRFSQKGNFNFNIEQLSVREISDRTIDLFDYQLAEKDITIINSIKDDHYILADENALLTIFRNIVSNAVKFTKKTGQIKLDAEEKNNFIIIKIQDSGVGMADSEIQKVLQGKHLPSSAGTQNEKGSGLGFSIVTEFVKKLNGEIDIISDGETGTTIILRFQKA